MAHRPRLPAAGAVSHVLRYEGTPGLWHLLLMPLARGGFPYGWFNYFSAAIAVGGVGVFLARSPLPRWMTALVPFTYFLAYQYAVVARQYVLLAPLLFLIAWNMYRDRGRRPLLLAGLLALLAHTSVHGLALAAAMALGWLADAARSWPAWNAALRRRHMAAGVLLLAAAAAAIVVLWPAADNAVKPWGGLTVAHPLLRTSGAIMKPCRYNTGRHRRTADRNRARGSIRRACCRSFSAARWPRWPCSSWYALADHHTGILLLYWLFCLWLSFDRRPQWERVARRQAGGRCCRPCMR